MGALPLTACPGPWDVNAVFTAKMHSGLFTLATRAIRRRYARTPDLADDRVQEALVQTWVYFNRHVVEQGQVPSDEALRFVFFRRGRSLKDKLVPGGSSDALEPGHVCRSAGVQVYEEFIAELPAPRGFSPDHGLDLVRFLSLISPADAAILVRVAEGLTRREIGRDLGLSPATVTRRTQALRAAARKEGLRG